MDAVNPVRVLIIGASYAGLAAATNLLDLSEGRPQRFSPTDPAPTTTFDLEITVVDERDGYYHVIGSPLALASPIFAQRSWTRFKDIPGLQHPAIKFVHGSVTRVDTERNTVKILPHGPGGRNVLKEPYDYLLAASGLRRVAPVVPTSLTRCDYLLEIGKYTDQLQNAIDKEGVSIIGGGAVGIEMAAEFKSVCPDLRVRLIHSRDQLMSNEPLPGDFKDKTLELLREGGVQVITGQRVEHISKPEGVHDPIRLTLSSGEIFNTSFVINAISHATPTTGYLPQNVLTDEGHVKIAPTLHFLPLASTNDGDDPSTLVTSTDTEPPYDPYHLAAGDIVDWPGIRRCGSAMHMGSLAAHNIHAHISSTLGAPSSSSSSIPTTTPPPYKSLLVYPPGIGLALGSTAIAYYPTEGIKHGPEILKMMFQDDIGFSICWNYMKLGEVAEGVDDSSGRDVVETERATQERRNEGKVEVNGTGVSSSISRESGTGSPVEPLTPSDAVVNVAVTECKDSDGDDVEGIRKAVSRATTKKDVPGVRIVEATET